MSTDEVYGSACRDGYFTEDSNYRPNSPYSSSKAASDHLVRAWYKTYNLPVIVSHCSNNFGPYQFPEKFVPVVINRALSQQAIPIYGEGVHERDWLFVNDHANALLKIIKKGQVGEVYNIGGDNVLSNIDLAHLICGMLDEIMPAKQSYKDLITLVQDRPGHDKRYAIDSSHIYNTLGWSPDMTLSEGLRETVHWYLENQDWIASVSKNLDQKKRLGLLS